MMLNLRSNDVACSSTQMMLSLRSNDVAPSVQMKKPPTGAKGAPAKSVDFVGESRKKKRCFQPLDFPRRQRLPRSSCGKAIASLRGMNERRRRTNCKRSLFVATPIAKPHRLTPQVCFADYRLCRTFGIKMPPRTIRSPQNNGVPAKRSFVGKRSGSPSSEAAICKYFYKANRGEPKGLAATWCR